MHYRSEELTVGEIAMVIAGIILFVLIIMHSDVALKIIQAIGQACAAIKG